ncbi:MAG: hypothetical protein HOY78_48195 [Saccharothrix sp.]|nr:hypothetical protein [Saccharothrix sp.]
MDPISGLASAGGTAAGRLTHYLVLQLTSVILPGAVALTELTMLGVHFYPHPGHDVTFLLSVLAKVQGGGAILFAALGIGASFVIGYVTRAIGFALTGRVERISARVARRRGRAVRSDLGRVRHVLGDEITDELTDLHPPLAHTDADGDDVKLPAGGAHRGDGSVHAFEYGKLWLRRFSPVLHVDSMEIEINILVATALPFTLAAVEALVFPRLPLAFRLVVVGVCAAAIVIALRQAIRLRHAERWYAVRNVAFDLAMRRAAARYPEVSAEE